MMLGIHHFTLRTGNSQRYAKEYKLIFLFLFFLVGDGLKIAIKAFDTGFVFIYFIFISAYPRTLALSVLTPSLRIPAREKKKIKIHQLMCRLVMK